MNKKAEVHTPIFDSFWEGRGWCWEKENEANKGHGAMVYNSNSDNNNNNDNTIQGLYQNSTHITIFQYTPWKKQENFPLFSTRHMITDTDCSFYKQYFYKQHRMKIYNFEVQKSENMRADRWIHLQNDCTHSK